jgi:transposase
MAIKRHKRNGRVYLAEYKSERIDGRVKSTYVRYIGVEGEPKIPPKKRTKQDHSIHFSRTTQAGDVSVLWHISENLGIPEIIDRFIFGNCNHPDITPGKVLTIWAINRVIDPESATQLPEWVRNTDLPLLSGISPESFTKDAFLSSLDFICYNDPSSGRTIDISAPIEESLYQNWRQSNPLPDGETEILAYDMTAVLFHGNSCPLSQLGYNSEYIKRKQVNLAILVSKFDRYPISHSTYSGERTSITTVNNLFSRLNDLSIVPGTLIWDRGNVSNQSIQIVEQFNWKIICGLPKTSKVVQNILLDTSIPTTPQYKIKNSECGHIYAKKIRARVFGKVRSVIVYSNMNAGLRDTEERNEILQSYSNRLDKILKNEENMTEKLLNDQLIKVLKSYYRFFIFRFKNSDGNITGEWIFNDDEISRAQLADGKYALLSTNDDLSAKEVVNEYFGKDFVEKRFQKMKSGHELMPVRHRLEHRVRSYIFLNMLALRINTIIFQKFQKICPENTDECVKIFLRKMSRVERTEVNIGNEIKTIFLNLTPELKETLKLIGLSQLFQQDQMAP